MKKSYIPTISFEVEPKHLEGLINFDPSEFKLRVICLKCETGFLIFGQLEAEKTINSQAVHISGPETEREIESTVQMFLRSGIFRFQQLIEDYKLTINLTAD